MEIKEFPIDKHIDVTTISRPILPYLGNNHLDFGCGDGALDNFITKRKPNVFITGYDQNESIINQAQKTVLNKNINFISDIDQIKNKKFDSFSAIFVYHDIKAANLFGAANHFLNSGSYFTIIDYNIKDIGLAKFQEIFNSPNEIKEAEEMGQGDACYVHTSKDLNDCLKAANQYGFKTIDSKKLNEKYFFWVGKKE
jgi:cyclopropane fatty-acyl-phospholipid synthase-like methyltransferase